MSASSETAGSPEDLAFLRDQVQRLSSLLSRYQKSHPSPPPLDDSALPEDGPAPLWLTEKRLLAPLLTEYDSVIGELTRQAQLYQSQFDSLSQQAQHITQENDRLHSELRQSLESQLGAAGVTGASTALQGLQRQLDSLSKDRDNYAEMWRQSSQELDQLQQTVKARAGELSRCKAELATAQQTAISSQKAMAEFQAACQQLTTDQQQYLKTVKAQERELSLQQESLSQARAELKAAHGKNNQLKSSLDDITLQLRKREANHQRSEAHEHSMDERLHLLQLTNADLEAKLLAAQREAALLKGETVGLEGRVDILQSKVAVLEQREQDTLVHVKESMALVEGALLEKEQAQVLEQQHADEVTRLKKAMAVLMGETGERVGREVRAEREECNKRIQEMAAEIAKLEEECAEGRVLLERAAREKRELQREVEKAQAQVPLGEAHVGERLQELQTRACVAERSREESQVRLESEATARKRAESSLSEERKAIRQLVEEHRLWQRERREEAEQAQQKNMKLINQCEELQQKLRTSEQAREVAEQSLVLEMAALAQRHELRERELTSRLEACEEVHQRSIHELREMLSAQHRIGTRWREESKALAAKFESAVAELRGEVIVHKRRTEELSLQLSHLKLSKDELSRKLVQASGNCSALQRQLADTESRLEAAAAQLSALLTRERQLLAERRELHREVDRLRLSIARNAGAHVGLAPSTLHTSTHKPSTHHTSTHKPSTLHTSTHQPSTHHKWTEALDELRHSIQQVRHDLALQSTDPQLRSRSQTREASPNDPSALARSDLSLLSNASSAVPS